MLEAMLLALQSRKNQKTKKPYYYCPAAANKTDINTVRVFNLDCWTCRSTDLAKITSNTTQYAFSYIPGHVLRISDYNSSPFQNIDNFF